MKIEDTDAYKRLLKEVEHDEAKSPGFHDYRGKLAWAMSRANHYAEKLGVDACDILAAWEAGRDYWYMNYYQDANQPEITADSAKVFDTMDELMASMNGQGFRCPRCGGVSKSPYECNSGLEIEAGKQCDWKVYGLFGALGKGIFVFVKEKVRGETIFMPIAWEGE